jgi:hypothetical protein
MVGGRGKVTVPEPEIGFVNFSQDDRIDRERHPSDRDRARDLLSLAEQVTKREGSQFQTKFIFAAEAACIDAKRGSEHLLSKHMEKDWRAIAFWLSRRYR